MGVAHTMPAGFKIMGCCSVASRSEASAKVGMDVLQEMIALGLTEGEAAALAAGQAKAPTVQELAPKPEPEPEPYCDEEPASKASSAEQADQVRVAAGDKEGP